MTTPTCKSIGCPRPAGPALNQDFCSDCQHRWQEHVKEFGANPPVNTSLPVVEQPAAEYTGAAVSYYLVPIDDPIRGSPRYTAECNDIIEALDMNWAEANAFKAIWRRSAARTLNRRKKDYDDGIYDAEKIVYYAQRMLVLEQRRQNKIRETGSLINPYTIHSIAEQVNASVKTQPPEDSDSNSIINRDA